MQNVTIHTSTENDCETGADAYVNLNIDIDPYKVSM